MTCQGLISVQLPAEEFVDLVDKKSFREVTICLPVRSPSYSPTPKLVRWRSNANIYDTEPIVVS